jgi:hypothetical protein
LRKRRRVEQTKAGDAICLIWLKPVIAERGWAMWIYRKSEERRLIEERLGEWKRGDRDINPWIGESMVDVTLAGGGGNNSKSNQTSDHRFDERVESETEAID